MEGVTFEYKHGSMNDLLAGKGITVKNFEELYGSPRVNGLVAPNFVGVFQKTERGMPKGLELMYEKLFQMGFSARHGGEDGAHPNLISVVYDHKTWKNEIVRMMMGRDVSGRVKLIGYQPTPDFSLKYTPSAEDTIENIRLLQEGAVIRNKVLDDVCGIFKTAKREFGLTREEAGFYMTFLMHASDLKIVPSVETISGEYEFLTQQSDETRREIDDLSGGKKPKK